MTDRSIPVNTIARLFKDISFKDPSTRITSTTLELCGEYIKLFINEAIIRSNDERVDEGDVLLKIDGLDKNNNNSKESQSQGRETQYVDLEDEIDLDDEDAYRDQIIDDPEEDLSNTQRQLQRNTTNNNGNGGGGDNRLDSRHLQKIAGVLTLDF
ncbi:hypothetical protein G210_0079 [Candida maltosa Xu316]|uniref:Uncharacterized protein n=1 Tax=Candida maltosa (strain Xu316) TaxID=1245528 RepID=M3IRR8_CANMX|nr:hypothetical protein G210_0079 [Candida maltosa Xu316]